METVGNPAFEQRSYFLVIDLSQLRAIHLFFLQWMSLAVIVRTLCCGCSNPGSNPGQPNPRQEQYKEFLRQLVFGPCGDSGPLHHQLPHGEAEDRGAVYQLLESSAEGGFVDPDKTTSLWLVYSRSTSNLQNN